MILNENDLQLITGGKKRPSTWNAYVTAETNGAMPLGSDPRQRGFAAGFFWGLLNG